MHKRTALVRKKGNNKKLVMQVHVEIKLISKEIDRQIIVDIIEKLEALGVPKGSKMKIENTGEEIQFGSLEGLALYLDGVNLSKEVYENSDPEAIINEVNRLAKIESNLIRYWHGNRESGMYFYGQSFSEMKDSIMDYISNNPECENCRVVQIA